MYILSETLAQLFVLLELGAAVTGTSALSADSVLSGETTAGAIRARHFFPEFAQSSRSPHHEQTSTPRGCTMATPTSLPIVDDAAITAMIAEMDDMRRRQQQQ